MNYFKNAFTPYHKQVLLETIEQKLATLSREEGEFLVAVRNPLKVIILLI